MRAPTMINHRGLISHFTAIKKKRHSALFIMPHLFSHSYGLFSFFQLLKVIRNFCHHWGIKHQFSILDTPGFLPLRPVRFILRMRSAVGPWALSVSCCFSIEVDCTRVFSSDRTDVGLLAARLPQNPIPHDQAAVSAQSKLTFPQTHKYLLPLLPVVCLSSPFTSHLSIRLHTPAFLCSGVHVSLLIPRKPPRTFRIV